MGDTFQNRLKLALELRGMKQVDLAEKTGFSKARISQWINGKHIADSEGLYIIANALNVSESWLMGEDVPMEYNRSELEKKCSVYEVVSSYYGADAYELIELFSKMNRTGRTEVLNAMRAWSKLPQYTISEKGEGTKMA